MSKRVTKASKFMSLVLRHKPEEIGLTLDANGWAGVAELVGKSGDLLDAALVAEVVATSDKKRFALSPDGLRIRANQGHSVGVDLNLPPSVPPETLFHGTADRFVVAIARDGLRPQSRQHVHLSPDTETARAVGTRHGRPVILTIRAGAMQAAGHVFWQSENGVWLTEAVPAAFIDIPT